MKFRSLAVNDTGIHRFLKISFLSTVIIYIIGTFLECSRLYIIKVENLGSLIIK